MQEKKKMRRKANDKLHYKIYKQKRNIKCEIITYGLIQFIKLNKKRDIY